MANLLWNACRLVLLQKFGKKNCVKQNKTKQAKLTTLHHRMANIRILIFFMFKKKMQT